MNFDDLLISSYWKALDEKEKQKAKKLFESEIHKNGLVVLLFANKEDYFNNNIENYSYSKYIENDFYNKRNNFCRICFNNRVMRICDYKHPNGFLDTGGVNCKCLCLQRGLVAK